MKILYSIFGLLFLVMMVYGQDPEITERILPEIRRMGQTGRLNCTIINQMDYKVYWIQKDTQTTISADDVIVIDPVHNEIVNGWPKYQVEVYRIDEKVMYSLIVSRLEPYDHGNYTCQIWVSGSHEHPSKDGELVVLVPPAIIQSKTSLTVSAKEGDNANLTCDASGYPTPNMTWIRVSGIILPNGELRYQSKFLEIKNISVNDRGIYRCLADNNVRPPSNYDTTLLVFFRPVARPVQSSYGQAERGMYDVVLECIVAGLPEPDLQWYRVGDSGQWLPIKNNDKYTVNILLNHANILAPHERWFQLVIRVVQAGDYGNYICEGKNNNGDGHGTVNLFETSECQGPNCPPEWEWPSAASNVIPSVVLIAVATVAHPFLMR